MGFLIRASLFAFILFANYGLVFSLDKVPEYVVFVDEIISDFKNEMEEKYGLICIGDGGSMPDVVRSISAQFQLFRRATTEEARLLEVLAIKRLADMVNNHAKIRPYLSEFPFPFKRVHVSISFYSPNGNILQDGNISFVHYGRNKIFYCTQDAFTGQLIEKFDESFEDAKKNVESFPCVSPFVHQEKPHEPLIDGVLAAYQREMFKDYRLEIDALGGKLVDGVEEVVVKLIYFQPSNLEKARELQIIATERLLDLLNNDEKLRPYITSYPLTLDNLKVSVLFRKKNYFPYFNGSLERASQEGNQICYYQKISVDENAKHPVQPRETPLYAKESYQEALSKVEGSRAVKKMKAKCSSQ